MGNIYLKAVQQNKRADVAAFFGPSSSVTGNVLPVSYATSSELTMNVAPAATGDPVYYQRLLSARYARDALKNRPISSDPVSRSKQVSGGLMSRSMQQLKNSVRTTKVAVLGRPRE